MQALQSLTRHQLVMASTTLDHDSVSEPGDPPAVLHQGCRLTTPTFPRRWPSGLRRTRSLNDAFNHSPASASSHHPQRRSHSAQHLNHVHHHHHHHHNNNNSNNNTPLRSPTAETQPLTAWSEYAVRKTLVRFRTRKSAAQMRAGRRLSGQRHVPAETIKEALAHKYQVCKSDTAGPAERLLAVLFCWFYGWIMDVYYHFTAEGTEKCFYKWTLASLLVTSGALIVLALSCVALHHLSLLILAAFNAGLLYVTLLVAFLICILGMLAIVNFD